MSQRTTITLSKLKSMSGPSIAELVQEEGTVSVMLNGEHGFDITPPLNALDEKFMAISHYLGKAVKTEMNNKFKALRVEDMFDLRIKKLKVSDIIDLEEFDEMLVGVSSSGIAAPSATSSLFSEDEINPQAEDKMLLESAEQDDDFLPAPFPPNSAEEDEFAPDDTGHVELDTPPNEEFFDGLTPDDELPAVEDEVSYQGGDELFDEGSLLSEDAPAQPLTGQVQEELYLDELGELGDQSQAEGDEPEEDEGEDDFDDDTPLIRRLFVKK